MESIKIILVSIVLAVIYGILHDLVTANIAIEYFTVGHPKILESESPFHMALLWGVIATWWVGLILGVLLAIAARFGARPKLGLSDVFNPMVKLLVVMALVATVAGIIGYFLAKGEVIYLVGKYANRIDADRHHLFLTAGWAHNASYIAGLIGGAFVSYHTWKKRKSK
ncbi:MAG: hypothetical protein AB8F95_10670 [Bacteroidia bacterium]